MNFFGIGLPEMAVIAAIGLLVFGPKRLPELGRTLGRTLKGFQSASREFEQEFRKAIDTETVAAATVPPAPLEAAADTDLPETASIAETLSSEAPAPLSPPLSTPAAPSTTAVSRPSGQPPA
jgi:sec-independent protein translocase protein TatA